MCAECLHWCLDVKYHVATAVCICNVTSATVYGCLRQFEAFSVWTAQSCSALIHDTSSEIDHRRTCLDEIFAVILIETFITAIPVAFKPEYMNSNAFKQVNIV